MFICEECSKGQVDSFWFLFGPINYGPCEDCGKTRECVDVDASALKPKDKEDNNG